MKFISIQDSKGVYNFSVDEVRHYKIFEFKEGRKTKAMVVVQMKPVKFFDFSEAEVLDKCESFDFSFEGIGDAMNSLKIIEI